MPKTAVMRGFAQQYRKMDPAAPEPPQEPPRRWMKGKELTAQQRRDVVARLLWELKDNGENTKFPRGVLTAVAGDFHVSHNTIRRIWARALQNFRDPTINQFRASPLKKNNCGRPQKWNRDDVREAVKEIPICRKRTIRSLAHALRIPSSTLFRMKGVRGNDAVIMPVSIATKPMLTEEHKSQRVFYCCANLKEQDHKYHDFYNSVHIDEKWFFISEQHLRVYIAPDEVIPNRPVQNKDHIMKVMFLCAVARPRFNANGECYFDGKIGMWPFIEYVRAQRDSNNRPRGTIITRTVSCNRDRYRQFVCQHVVPAIKEKWPDRNRDIIIQQDGAAAHIADNDLEFRQGAQQGLWNIRLLTQPAKSPDLNVLDLSFFRALQSAQWSQGYEVTIDGLIRQVQRAYRDFEPRKIDKGFLTLQTCMDEILTIHGANDYKLPHIRKDAMLRAEGTLPARLDCSNRAMEVYYFVMEGRPMLHERIVDDDNGDPPDEDAE